MSKELIPGNFRTGNVELTETELIVYGYYCCFGSCSAKRVKLKDIETVEEIRTTALNSKTCGQACTTTWWHCDPTNGCCRECKNMRGLVVGGKSFSMGITFADDRDYERVKQSIPISGHMVNVGAEK